MKSIQEVLSYSEMFLSLAETKSLDPQLQQVLSQISQLETFKERKECADKHLEPLSSGSARKVYVSPDQTQVIKLASNQKGLAQNKAESNPNIKSKFANTVTAYDPNFNWIVAPKLNKLTEKEFEQLTHIDFKDFAEAVKYAVKVEFEPQATKPKNFDQIEHSPLLQEMIRLATKFKLTTGDIARISSWGTDGIKPILIDLGLTREIYKTFYSSSNSKSK